MSYFDGYFGPSSSGSTGGSTSSTNKQMLETELQISLPGYSEAYIDSLFSSASDLLKIRTKRSSFSGLAQNTAEQAILYLVIDRLATSNRDILKGSIKEIDENGSKIVFNNGKDLSTYKTEAEYLISNLKLSGVSTPSQAIYTNCKTFYR